MKAYFTIRRILALVAVVVLLAFVYFMVRAGYSLSLDYLQNPARFAAGDDGQEKADDGSLARINAALNEAEKNKKSDYLVVENAEDPVSVRLRDSIEFALGCIGQQPVYTQAPTAEQIRSATGGIIISSTFLDRIENFQYLLDYAAGGGTLIFAVRSEVDDTFRNIYQQLGIYEHNYFKWSEGFHLRKGILTKEDYDVEGAWIDNSVIELHVTSECDVLATSDDGIPLIWTLPYGRGNILYMNNSLMTYKASGGLMLSLLSRVNGPMIYPVINARVLMLEAFPLPSDVNRDFMSATYLRSGEAFLRDVWWPEMVKLSRIYGLPYTAGFMTKYDDEQPYSSASVINESVDMVFFAKELSKLDGELALTGFNQKPLYFGQQSDQMQFEMWSSEELAQERTNEAVEIFNVFFPKYNIYSYLPPERVLDETGYDIVKEALPKLTAVSGDFWDDDRWQQDFGVKEDGVVNFPAITSGFAPGSLAEWSLLCAVNALGVVSHVCDVSDIMLETSAENSWNNISSEFSDFVADYIGGADYLEGTTLTEAAVKLKDMVLANPEIAINDNSAAVSINYENMPESVSFMLLCPGKTPSATQDGIKIKEVSEGRFLVTATINSFILELN